MRPEDIARLEKVVRDAKRLRELERSGGDYNLGGDALSARAINQSIGSGTFTAGAGTGVSIGGHPATGNDPEGGELAAPSPQGEIIVVVANAIADGGLLTFTSVQEPPQRGGFDRVVLPSTDIPVSLNALYSAQLDIDWGNSQGGRTELLVEDTISRFSLRAVDTLTVHIGRLRPGMPLRVRAIPNGGSARIKVRLLIQTTSPVNVDEETVVHIDPALPDPLPAPSAPALVEASTEFDNASLTVSWKAVPGAVSYEVRAVRDSDGFTTVVDVPGTETQVTIDWLDPLTAYRVSVWAWDEYGQASLASAETLMWTVGDTTVPSVPRNVQVTKGINSLFVQWVRGEERDIDFFEVQLARNSSFTTGLVEKESEGIGVVPFTELDGNTDYFIRVRAVDLSNNKSAWSETITARPDYVDVAFDWDLPAQSITSDLLAIGAVLSHHIGTNVITGAQLADGSIDVSKLVDNAITAAKLAPGAVVAGVIAAGAVTAEAIAANAVVATKIAANTITANHITAGAITAAKIRAGAVTAEKIAAGTITANEIATGTITANSGIIGSLSANVISTGTLNAARIAANSLEVNKLTSSTLTSRTITIGTGGSLQVQGSSSARLLIDSTGLRLFNTAGTLMVRLRSSDGNAYFRGDITASSLTSSSISSTNIDGGRITGTLIRTKATGTRVEIQSGAEGITFFNSSNNTTSTLRQGNSDGLETSGSFRVGGSLGNRTLYTGAIIGVSNNWAITSNGTGRFASFTRPDGTARMWLEDLGVTVRGAQSDYRFRGNTFRPVSNNPLLGWSSAGRWGQIYSTSSSLSTASDARLKQDIEDTPLGLDFINALRPVHFRHKPKPGINGKRFHQGLLAQEVKSVLDEIGYTSDKFAGYEDSKFMEPSEDGEDPGDELSLRYGDFIAPLIKAVQELSNRIEELENA